MRITVSQFDWLHTQIRERNGYRPGFARGNARALTKDKLIHPRLEHLVGGGGP